MGVFIRGEISLETSLGVDSDRGLDCRRRSGLGTTGPHGATSPAAPDGAHDDVPLHAGEYATINPGATEADARLVAGVPHVADIAATKAGPAPTEKVNWTKLPCAGANQDRLKNFKNNIQPRRRLC